MTRSLWKLFNLHRNITLSWLDKESGDWDRRLVAETGIVPLILLKIPKLYSRAKLYSKLLLKKYTLIKRL